MHENNVSLLVVLKYSSDGHEKGRHVNIQFLGYDEGTQKLRFLVWQYVPERKPDNL